MAFSFYKSGNIWIVNGNVTPPRTLVMRFDPNDPTVVRFTGINNNYSPTKAYNGEWPNRFIKITEIEKNDTPEYYADKAELIGALEDFFKASGDGGNPFDQSLNTTDSPSFAGQTINGLANIQELRFNSKIVPAALNADTHNWAPTNLQTNGRIVASATIDIDLTGIDSTNIADGEIRILENSNGSSGRFTFINNSASSLAPNRFYMNANRVINENEAVVLMYSSNVGVSGGWILLSL